MNIRISEIDVARFDAKIAKATISPNDSILEMVKWCEDRDVEMLIARCSTSESRYVQMMECAGFQLMDTLVYFEHKSVTRVPVDLPVDYSIREGRTEDAGALEEIAVRAFGGFFGHYHADARLRRIDCNMVYSSWAANSLKSKAVADVVFVVENRETLVAFLTLKRRSGSEAEIILNAVDPAQQGKGIYAALVSSALNWAEEVGITNILVSTQVNNIAPQKVWCRYGFEPLKSFYTFHKWFNL